MTLLKSDPKSAEAAARILLEGKIAVLPTDTIYGFSALSILDGKSSGLDVRIDEIKKSEKSKPLIELISEPKDVYKYTDQKIPPELFEKWPGPLTIIVKNNQWYESLTGREATAFRCPGEPWLRRVIALCNSPVYSTSVNFSGSAPLTDDESVLREFGGQIALFVSDAQKPFCRPSALVSIADGNIKVVRPGSDLAPSCIDG